MDEVVFNLLVEHGYKGENTIDSIITWLEEKLIYIGIEVVFFENDEEIRTLCGYSGELYLQPYDSIYHMATYKSRKDLYEAICLKLISLGYV